jgi:hypothetical protein
MLGCLRTSLPELSGKSCFLVVTNGNGAEIIRMSFDSGEIPVLSRRLSRGDNCQSQSANETDGTSHRNVRSVAVEHRGPANE